MLLVVLALLALLRRQSPLVCQEADWETPAQRMRTSRMEEHLCKDTKNVLINRVI